MKLREVILAISGFKYIIDEYDIFPNNLVKKQRKEVKIEETGMRCLQNDLRHEKLVKGGWVCLSEEEFKYQLESDVSEKTKPTVILRRGGEIHKKASAATTFLDFVKPTNHFKKRANQRFDVTLQRVQYFITKVLDARHFVVQNAELYNGWAQKNKHKPTDAIICSLPTNTLLVVRFDESENEYVLVTCYPMNTTPWFLNWFQDNMERVHELPNIQQYFNFKKKENS